MDRATLMEDMRQRLESALQPLELHLTDDSAAHAGHAGAAGGGGHFQVRIVTSRFTDRSKVTRHRMVYDALAELMGRHIHALAIEALAPGDRARSA